jgi:hypothetical protein
MARRLKRVSLADKPEIRRIAEQVRDSGEPFVLDVDGEAVAVIVPPDAVAGVTLTPKSARHKAEIMALAGAWAHLDADKLLAYVDRARHESPPSPPPGE